jgi:hypothetical protein
VAEVDDAIAAFDALLDELTALEDSNPRWLDIAARLLTFCHKFAPPPDAWRLPQFEPWSTILQLEVRVADELLAIDRAASRVVSSFATRDHVQALCDAAKRELNPAPFRDAQLSRAVVARALAGAIDNTYGATYVEWFKSCDAVTITEGKPYPVCSHDPKPWLNGHGANTKPENQPSRELEGTPRLRIATGPLRFNFVLDFKFWGQLSLLGSRKGLAIAAAQPNLDPSEFDVRFPPAAATGTYENRGPKDVAQQVDRIMRLVDEAMAQDAEVVLVPEYAASEAVHTALVQRFETSATVPIVFCAGMARGPDSGYINNEAWLLVTTPGIEPVSSAHFHAKTFRAKLVFRKAEAELVLGKAQAELMFGKDKDKVVLEERIHIASEVRVFVSQQWSLSVLICLEAMAGEIIEQLALIGTNLLLIPAMSEKTANMVGTISRLGYESQAFVAMVNGPASWPGATTASRCEAFFGGPYADAPSSWTAPLAGATRPADEIATWVFRASQQDVTSYPLPADNS